MHDTTYLGLQPLPLTETAQRYEVTLDDLFCEAFMIEHTNVRSIVEFFINGGLYPASLQEIEEIPRDVLDLYTAGTTFFTTWHEMLEKAVDALFLRMGIHAEAYSERKEKLYDAQ